jgi:hydrogenase expression/formation protein HypC
MCLVLPGRVLAIDGATAAVAFEGRVRRASLLLEPDVTVGDWVLVAAGTVLRRLEPDEALELADTIRAAVIATNARTATDARQGGLP